jgi:hypothetical protein
MDTKTAIFGAVVAAVSIGGAKLITTPTTVTQVVAASDKPADVAAAEVAQQGDSAEKLCELQREGTDKGIVLSWVCNGARMPDKTQAELTKLAGEGATSIRFTPRDDKGVTVLDATVTKGVLPNLDPVPVVGEAKPVEAEKMPAQSIPVDEKP